jgi:uncharacterized protein YggE
VTAAPPAPAAPELRGSPADLQRFLRTGTHTVVLSGHAKLTVQSDLGHVTVIVHTQGKELATALAANANRREALIHILQQQGIDPKNIRAQKFSASPQYGWFGKNPTSYEVINRLTVTISDDGQLTAIAAASAQSPDYSLGTTEFEYSKKDEIQERVRQQAFDDALAKKSFYEQRLGAVLRPVEFRFSDGSARATPGAAELEEIVVTARRANSSSPESPPPPTFDEQEYETSVDVTFEVEGTKAP